MKSLRKLNNWTMQSVSVCLSKTLTLWINNWLDFSHPSCRRKIIHTSKLEKDFFFFTPLLNNSLMKSSILKLRSKFARITLEFITKTKIILSIWHQFLIITPVKYLRRMKTTKIIVLTFRPPKHKPSSQSKFKLINSQSKLKLKLIRKFLPLLKRNPSQWNS
jgi:hypothetical protein